MHGSCISNNYLNVIVKQGCSIVLARTKANTAMLCFDSLHSDTNLSSLGFVSMEINYFHQWYQDH